MNDGHVGSDSSGGLRAEDDPGQVESASEGERERGIEIG